MRSSPHSSQRKCLILLGLITVAGALIRIPGMGDTIFGDELSTYFMVMGRDFLTTLDYVKGEQEITPPLYFLVAWFPANLGDPTVMLRIPSYLAGVAIVPLVYVLGTWSVNRKVGLVSSALVAFSPFLIFFSSEARAYSFLTFLTLLSTLALLLALRKGQVRWWVAFAVLCAASMYTHYTALFVLVTQFVWAFVFFPKSRKALLLSAAGAAVSFLPWLPQYIADSDSIGSKTIEFLRPFSWDSFWYDVRSWAFERTFVVGTPSTGNVYLFLYLGVVAGVLGLAREIMLRYRTKESLRPSNELILIVSLALAAPVLAAVVSTFSVSVFLPRNLATSWPGLAVSFAALVLASRTTWLKIVGVTGLIVFFGYLGLSTVDSDNRRPDYQAAADFVAEEWQPGDEIVQLASSQPAPITPVDVALDNARENIQPDLPQPSRLGIPSKDLQTRVSVLGGEGRYTYLPIEEPEALAERTATRKGGALYLITPASDPLLSAAYAPDSTLAKFISALPKGVQSTAVEDYAGFAGGASVVTFERESAP
ncbi:MAG: glycosyltransferase family 39 protein [Solirubrobacterales bacterium]